MIGFSAVPAFTAHSIASFSGINGNSHRIAGSGMMAGRDDLLVHIAHQQSPYPHIARSNFPDHTMMDSDENISDFDSGCGSGLDSDGVGVDGDHDDDNVDDGDGDHVDDDQVDNVDNVEDNSFDHPITISSQYEMDFSQ